MHLTFWNEKLRFVFFGQILLTAIHLYINMVIIIHIVNTSDSHIWNILEQTLFRFRTNEPAIPIKKAILFFKSILLISCIFIFLNVYIK